MRRELYPDDWEDLSRRVREKAGQRCEWCGVANGALGARDSAGMWWSHDQIESVSDAHLERWFGGVPKITKVVLTVHHIDADKANSDRSNLVALCQRCHLSADRPLHMANAAATRARKRQEAIAATGQLELI